MAQISVTIPDNQVARVVGAIAAVHNYQATLPGGGDNPETRASFARRMLVNQMKQWVAQYEGAAADTAARQSVSNDATLIT